MIENPKTQTERNKIKHYEDEIDLMDYLLVIWKRKYIIIAGTFAFALTVAIISWNQQPQMYRTSIDLKPGVLKIDETGKKVFIDTPENIKALIENELKFKVLEQLKKSNNLKPSTALDFQVDIQKGSDIINVSLESASADESTAKLNYLIIALSDELTNKIKFIQKKVEKRIEEKKYEFEILLFKEKEMRTKIKKYEKELSDIEVKKTLLKDSKDISQNKEYMLSKLSLENDYRNTFQIYFKENEYAKFNLFELHKKTSKLLKEIEKLEKKQQNIQIIQIVQPSVTTEIPKNNKIKRKVILSSAVGLFLMLFLSFFLEYLSKYKSRSIK